MPLCNFQRRGVLGVVGGVLWVVGCWVNFQCRGLLLVRKIVGQGPTVLAVGGGGGCLNIFSLICHFSSFSLFLGDGPIWTEILSDNRHTNRRVLLVLDKSSVKTGCAYSRCSSVPSFPFLFSFFSERRFNTE